MTQIEQKIAEFEQRAAVCSNAELERRISMYHHFSAINRFEGIVPSSVDERLFLLLASGKISKDEYIRLCLDDAHGFAG